MTFIYELAIRAVYYYAHSLKLIIYTDAILAVYIHVYYGDIYFTRDK